MAGRPQRRARREARAAHDAPPNPPAPAHYAHAHEHAHEHAPGRRAEVAPPLRGVARGPEVRAVSDHAAAEAVAGLRRHLPAAVKVRIKRLRPLWCRGWIEDYPLAGSDIGELLEYLKAEHGGQEYELLLLSESEEPIYTTKAPIYGPPRDAGRMINRDAYEAAMNGRTQAQAQAQAAAPAAAQSPLDLVAVLTLVLDEARQSRQTTLDSVRELTQRTSDSNEKLMSLIVKTRADEKAQASFPAQLAELSEGLKAVDKMKRQISPAGDHEPTNGKSPMDSAVQEVAADFLRKVVASEKQPDRPAPPAPTIPEARQDKQGG